MSAAPDCDRAPEARGHDAPKGIPVYAMTLLVLIYVLNCLDRMIMNILAEPISKDLGLHDWQIGVMTGLAFAIFYAGLGIPIARLAERGNRSQIIAVSVFFWSLATAACAIARNFPQIVLARIGVGVGEAGCTPAAHSLITDIVPREKRATALGTYSMGSYIGSLLGMAMGGLIADSWGWRVAFLVAAAPGLLLAPLAWLTLKEPRIARRQIEAASVPAPSFPEAMRELRSCRTFILLSLAGAFGGLMVYGFTSFVGSFFFRNHGIELSQLASSVGLQPAGFLGVSIGVVFGVGGILGSIAGGFLCDRLSISRPTTIVLLPGICNLLAVPAFIVVLLHPSAAAALVLLAIPALLTAMGVPPLFTAVQSIVNPRTRATAVAVYMLVANLIGLGIGPVIVGLISDYLSVGVGLGSAEGLRWGLIAGTLILCISAGLCLFARKHIVREMVH